MGDVQAVSTMQSLDRAFLIIETLAKNPKGVPLSELCAMTGLPKGTVSRMLASLIAHHYAMQDTSSKQYRLTLRMFEVGCQVIGSVNILSVAQPYLDNLSRMCNEVVHLVARVGDEIVYLYKDEARNTIARMTSSVGLHSPMYCTGVGKSILAFLPKDEVQEIWRRTKIVKFTDNTITTLKSMEQELAEIRRRGYAIDNGEHEADVRCIAAPILDYNASPIAAVSISVSAERLPDERIQELLPMLFDAVNHICQYYGA